MPKLGEIKLSSEVGYKCQGHRYHIWAACEKCGIERWVQLVRGKARVKLCLKCSRQETGFKMRGANNHRWIGGTFNDGRGYKMSHLEPDDFFYPMATNKRPKYGGYVFEHRLVMARHLNRCLLPWEVVHHKNGIKDDNRIENLELLTGRKQHLVDVKTKSYIGKIEAKLQRQSERITRLEQRVMLLEAENLLLKAEQPTRFISKEESRGR